jgi:Na+-driven multidrug efflux pump
MVPYMLPAMLSQLLGGIFRIGEKVFNGIGQTLYGMY